MAQNGRMGRRMTDNLWTPAGAAKFIAQVGVPTTVAAVLLWFVLTHLNDTQRQLVATNGQIVETQGTIVANQKQIISLLTAHEQTMQASLWIQAAMCANAAATEMERSRCLTGMNPRRD